MTACGITGEQRLERNDVRDLKAQYEKKYIVVSSKPASRIFDDVNLICKVEAQTYADKVSAEEREMLLNELEGRSGHAKTQLLAIKNSGLGMRRPYLIKDGYQRCMNTSGWDIRNVCVRNCSVEAHRLYDLKRAEYKARYP